MAIFGNDNADLLRQVLAQLGQISTDLAALKQQAADQQHAIDQIRQDTAAALTTGLTENRTVIRDGLDRARDTIGDPLTRISTELVAIRSGISRLDDQLKTRTDHAPAPPAPDRGAAPKPEPAPAEQAEERVVAFAETQDCEPDEPDSGILRAAAGIAHATVEGHRDTWAFLIQVAGNAEHFHIPGEVTDDDGFVSVRLSGPSLVAAITSLAHTTRNTPNAVTRAIADHIHGKITNAVQAIIDRPHSGDPGTPVRITIDDRARPDDQADEEQPGTGS
ncbi:hypothetical protein [Streptomyces sp. KN37]|uniref:hypothetical protein n=1 Tax=Streptomyces sp. KN37 TaxID=3090667 RepID=UPI002A74DCC2|nr:hypothetical protein [Streptomyces sp. KN37]WPO70230.1 hypothetical protein R9806_06100 [Streptomyces sp. KN37]